MEEKEEEKEEEEETEENYSNVSLSLILYVKKTLRESVDYNQPWKVLLQWP